VQSCLIVRCEEENNGLTELEGGFDRLAGGGAACTVPA